nr:unnamed protein product [Spirometra erinaceieuropaei]
MSIGSRLRVLACPIDFVPTDPSLVRNACSELAQRLVNLPVVDVVVTAATDDNAPVEDRWCQLRDAVQSMVLVVLGRARRQNQDWFDDNDDAIIDLLAEKNRLHKAYVDRPTDDNGAAFNRSLHLVQQRLREMQDAWTARKAEGIQGYADRNEWKKFLSAIKAVYGLPTNGPASIISADGSILLTEKAKILRRWAEHLTIIPLFVPHFFQLPLDTSSLRVPIIYGSFRQARSFEVGEFSRKQRQELRQAFDLMDVKGKGSIDIADIQLPLRALGFHPSRDELRALCSKYDPDKKGTIDFSGFLTLLSNKMLEEDAKEDLVRAFRLFDIKDRGYITFQDLRKVSKTLDEDLHDEDLQEMIEKADRNGDGVVDEEEFMQMIWSSALY